MRHACVGSARGGQQLGFVLTAVRPLQSTLAYAYKQFRSVGIRRRAGTLGEFIIITEQPPITEQPEPAEEPVDGPVDGDLMGLCQELAGTLHTALSKVWLFPKTLVCPLPSTSPPLLTTGHFRSVMPIAEQE